MINFFKDLIKKIKFSIFTDRIGPDIPFTHWMLYLPSTMNYLCKKKFLKFGENAEVRPMAYAVYTSQISIGNNVIIRPNTVLMADEYAKIYIEDNVLMGMGVHIYVNNHKYDDISKPILEQGYYLSKDVVIKQGSWIGANVIILSGVTVGSHSVVGAGSVVTKNVPDYTIVAGSPAKIIKRLK